MITRIALHFLNNFSNIHRIEVNKKRSLIQFFYFKIKIRKIRIILDTEKLLWMTTDRVFFLRFSDWKFQKIFSMQFLASLWKVFIKLRWPDEIFDSGGRRIKTGRQMLNIFCTGAGNHFLIHKELAPLKLRLLTLLALF